MINSAENTEANRRKHLNYFTRILVTSLCIICADSYAARNYAFVTKFPNFSVKSNGSHYTKIDHIGYGWEGKIHFHWKKNKRKDYKILDWSVGPDVAWKRKNGEMEKLLSFAFSPQGVSKEYPIGKRPRSVTKGPIDGLGKIISDAAVSTDVIAACEENANDLRASGMTNQEIFAKDRVLPMSVSLLGSASIKMPIFPVTFGGGYKTIGSSATSATPKHKITCKKWSGPTQTGQTSDVAVKNAVTDFSFNINEKVTLGYCGVTLTGSITTAVKDTKVQYQFEEQGGGKKSKIYSVNTSAQNSIDDGYYAPFQHKFEVPISETGPEVGNIRIKGKNFSFNSGWQSYSMECNPPIADDIAVELPPILSLEVKPQDNIMVDGQICPSRVRLVAGIKARSHMAGKLLFVGNQYISSLHQFQIAMGNNKQIGDYRDINWDNGNIEAEVSQTVGEQPLRTKTFNVGYNIIDMDGALEHQYAKEQFKLTCTRPQVSVHLPADQDFAPNNAITNFWSKTKTKSSMNGDACGIRVSGGLQIIGSDSEVRLAIQNHQGFVLKNLSFTASKFNESTFSEYIDLRGTFGGKWIQPSGGLGTNKPAKGARYNGTLRVVGKSHDIAEKTLDYEVLCRTDTNHNTVGGLADPGDHNGKGLSKVNKSLKTSVQFGSSVKKPKRKLAGAKALKLNKKPSLKSASAKLQLKKKPGLKLASVSVKTQKKPASKLANVKIKSAKTPKLKLAGIQPKNQKLAQKLSSVKTKPGKKPALKLTGSKINPKSKSKSKAKHQQVLAVAKVAPKNVDLGINELQLKPKKKKGVVFIILKLANHGTIDSSGKVVIEVKNGKGKVVKTFSEKIKLAKGAETRLKRQFKMPKARLFTATAKVSAKRDTNRKNNIKKARAMVR